MIISDISTKRAVSLDPQPSCESSHGIVEYTPQESLDNRIRNVTKAIASLTELLSTMTVKLDEITVFMQDKACSYLSIVAGKIQSLLLWLRIDIKFAIART
jgi:hypothetical protein